MELKKAPRIFGVFFLTKKWKMSFCTSEVTIFFEKSFLVTKNGNRGTRWGSKSFKLLKKRGYQRLPKMVTAKLVGGVRVSRFFCLFLAGYHFFPQLFYMTILNNF